MAAGDVDVNFSASKVFFECCKTRPCAYVTCIKCGKVFHKSCALRDFSGKVKFVDETRLFCCDENLTSTADENQTKITKQEAEIVYLKQLLDESKKKVVDLEGTLKKQKSDESRMMKSQRELEIECRNHQAKIMEKEAEVIHLRQLLDERMKKIQSLEGILKNKKSDESRMMKPQRELETEIGYLKRLVEETTDKNNILKENNRLLLERIELQKTGNRKELHYKVSSYGNQDQPHQVRPSRDIDLLNQTEQPETAAVSTVHEDRSNRKQSDAAKKQAPIATPTHQVVQTPRHSTEEALDELDELNLQPPGSDWITVNYKNKRGAPPAAKYSNRYPKLARPAPIKGTKDITLGEIEVAKIKSWFFVSGYSPSTTAETLTNYIKSNLKMDSLCVKLKTKKDNVKGSFKIGIDEQHKEEFLNPDLWPRGIVVNHFLNLRRRPLAPIP